ncbi:MAG: PepSY domain-containing protein [Aestuariibacter sp.]
MKLLIKALLASLLLFGSFTPAVAYDDDNAAKRVAKTKAEAARKAQRQVKGRVLKVEQRGDVFRVKLLQASGRVVSIEIRRVPNSGS